MYFEKPIELWEQKAKWALGANISNIGSKMSYTDDVDKNFIPTNLRIGTALTINLDKYNSLAIMADLNKLLVPTPPVYALDTITDKYYIAEGNDPDVSVVGGMFQSFSDAPNGFSEEIHEITYSIGLEYWYDKQFALRAGYFNEHEAKGNRKYFALGAGFKYNVFGIDFSYLIPTEQHNPLENTLRFSLSFDFDSFRNQNKKI